MSSLNKISISPAQILADQEALRASVSDFFKFVRKEVLSLSQIEMGNLLSLHQAAICRIEQGEQGVPSELLLVICTLSNSWDLKAILESTSSRLETHVVKFEELLSRKKEILERAAAELEADAKRYETELASRLKAEKKRHFKGASISSTRKRIHSKKAA